jgi:hypothetical protein
MDKNNQPKVSVLEETSNAIVSLLDEHLKQD